MHRKEQLAPVTIPVLEWRCSSVELDYVRATPPANASMASPAVADLPFGFSSLWLHTDYIGMVFDERPGGMALPTFEDVDEDSGAEDLCQFFRLAPGCYKDFRLFVGGRLTISPLRFMAEYNMPDIAEYYFDSLQDIAAAMRRVAGVHGLAVSVSRDETYLHVVRIRDSVQRV